jgi:ubiquinone/menaquinone biosynthesis C-methylase UbiE
LKSSEIAKQLRLPTGKMAVRVGEVMYKANKFIYKLTFSILKKYIHKKTNILEIGPGNGMFINHLFELNKNIRYHAIDWSSDMVKEARKNTIEFSSNIGIKKGISSKITYPDNIFDIVFSVNTIYFWEKPSKDLAEIKRVLKKNGILILSFRTKEYMKDLDFAKHFKHKYNYKDCKKLLNENGYDIIEWKRKNEPTVHLENRIISTDAITIAARIIVKI